MPQPLRAPAVPARSPEKRLGSASPETANRSKIELQPELDVPRLVDHTRDRAEGRGLIDGVIRRAEARMVEQIEELGPEVEIPGLAQQAIIA